eukprot:CAMPEP_0202726174 /NCGR_PEP_ID=MMETSP1385-20130828/184476_1 /ASSEMBLY_ACC=CAM_ASM_000861 /TAXON_ID=933848 /ORGANISM="Elphidium margaritaceum" /LENGTH=576 /DNA_ID=CAMNT_0049392387 /DNA_START=73 /DNA_END=1803 /DNA_ORIENTATION=+
MLHLHSNSYTEIPSNSHYNNFAAAATSSMVGPTRVCNLDAIRHLFQRHDLTEQVVLSLAREALCHGVRCNRQDVPSSYAYAACHMVAYSNLVFVFSERFDALVSITAGAMQTPDSSSPPPPPTLKLIDTAALSRSCDADDELTGAEFEDIFDEIVDIVHHDVNNDPELSCSSQSWYQTSAAAPATSPLVTHTPATHKMLLQRLHHSASLHSMSEGDSPSEFEQYGQQHTQTTFDNVDVRCSDGLWTELAARYQHHRHHFPMSKNELVLSLQQLVQTARTVPSSDDEKVPEVRVWHYRGFVYIAQHSTCQLTHAPQLVTLLDAFELQQFNNQYAQCVAQVRQRFNAVASVAKMAATTTTANAPGTRTFLNASETPVPTVNASLRHSSSGRSIVSAVSAVSASSSDSSSNSNYHTIYVKPIIERMKQQQQLSQSSSVIDSDYVLRIVDNAIKHGRKRQISKRTFEFKWDAFTVIMSKSLRTILDVVCSTDPDVITVHPDVVSIVSKKSSQLQYRTIQALAKWAKTSVSFITKKNDYRQQFIYEYCGCRFVFASNHATIVEMQCSDFSALPIRLDTAAN